MFNCLNKEQRRQYQGLRPRGSQGKDHSWLFRLPFEGNWIPWKGFMKKGVVVCLVLCFRMVILTSEKKMG